MWTHPLREAPVKPLRVGLLGHCESRKRAECCFESTVSAEENSLSLTEFWGKLGEFCEKLGEFAFAHK